MIKIGTVCLCHNAPLNKADLWSSSKRLTLRECISQVYYPNLVIGLGTFGYSWATAEPPRVDASML